MSRLRIRDCRSGPGVSRQGDSGLLRLALLLGLFFATSLVAQEADYLQAYRNYQTAFETGNVAAALTHGEAAWRGADAALGDHPTTAVLAYNYARLAFPFPATAERAEEAYQRALDLSSRGIGELDQRDVRIGLAEVRLIMQKDVRNASGDLTRLLRDRQEAGTPPSDLSAHAWKTLSSEHLRQGLWTTAAQYADIAASEAAALTPPDRDVLIDAFMFGAMARLSEPVASRPPSRLAEAIERLNSTIAMYPPQSSIDSFDKRLAMALVWRASVEVMQRSGKGEQIGDLSKLTEVIPMAATNRPENCPELAEVLVQTPISFPTGGVQQGDVGAVLFGLDLNDSGVERVVVLGEPQGGLFGAEVTRVVKTWKLKAAVPPGCEHNWVTFAFFAKP
jgi:tetratricopeptide (TPR) repeat protein